MELKCRVCGVDVVEQAFECRNGHIDPLGKMEAEQKGQVDHFSKDFQDFQDKVSGKKPLR